MLAELIAYLEQRCEAMRSERRAAQVGELAARYPDWARDACDEVMPPNLRKSAN